jgi:hypothetical protein
MSKYVKSYEINSLSNNDIYQKVCRGQYRGMRTIYYFVIDKCARGCTKERKAEILNEFDSVTDGFFWTDELVRENMITNVNFIMELRKLLAKKKFNSMSFGGELHILFS